MYYIILYYIILYYIILYYIILYSGVGRCQKVCVCVCVCGGGGVSHRHVMYVPLVKNQYKRVVFGYIVIK